MLMNMSAKIMFTLLWVLCVYVCENRTLPLSDSESACFRNELLITFIQRIFHEPTYIHTLNARVHAACVCVFNKMGKCFVPHTHTHTQTHRFSRSHPDACRHPSHSHSKHTLRTIGPPFQRHSAPTKGCAHTHTHTLNTICRAHTHTP